MQVDLTVSGPGGRRDVRIDAPGPVRLDEIDARLRTLAGWGPADRVRCDGRAVRPEELVGGPGLLSGCVLSARAPGPARPDDPAPLAAGLLDLAVVGGPSAGRRIALGADPVLVGRAADCDLQLNDDRVSRRHSIVRPGQRATVTAIAERSPTALVGRGEVGDEPEPITTHDRLRIGDSLLRLVRPDRPSADTAIRDGVVRVASGERPVVRRPTQIEVPQSGTRPRRSRLRWLSWCAPVAVAVALAIGLHSFQFLLFGLLSPLAMVSSSPPSSGGPFWRRRRTDRRGRAEFERRVAIALDDEVARRRAADPDPADVHRAATARARPLWDRRRGDEDLLRVCLGTGPAAATTVLVEGTERRSAGTLADVPFGIDLRTGPLRLSGPAPVVDGVARWVVAQLATLAVPTDVQLAMFVGPGSVERWRWTRWLPHVADRVAVGTDEAEVLAGRLAAARAAPDRGGWRGPWLVVVADVEMLAVPGVRGLLEQGMDAGCTGVLLGAAGSSLPRCATLATVTGDVGSQVLVRCVDGEEQLLVADRVEIEWAARVARSLAPLRPADNPEAEGVRPIRLTELLGLPPGRVPEIEDVRALWRAGNGSGADTVLGWASDGPITVDLAADGPHALVVGTTGSGKSELLRTLVAGLALAHPPADTSFVLVDYKGGAAFGGCRMLPHVVGLVTDLDERLTARALRSLDVELRRREQLLATVGAADLDAYRAADGVVPLPRLVIVVDEFAALAASLPDFLRGLVGVAQRGRSLGIHLVLATQRPGAAVSPEIRANTSLRIALRVTDPAESTDVLGVPDAARLDPQRPGSAFMRRGNDLVGFRAARVSRAHSDNADELSVTPLDGWRRDLSPVVGDDHEALEELVGLLARTAAAEADADAESRSPSDGPVTPEALWLDPLPDRLPVSALPEAERRTRVAFGRVDLPLTRAQPTLDVDLDAGVGLALVGGSRSGRTAALCTVAITAARRLGPDKLEIYALDGGHDLVPVLEPLPHVATASADPETAARLLGRLRERAQAGAAGGVPGGAVTDAPAVRSLLLIDDWDRLLESWDDSTASAAIMDLAALARDGARAAVSVVLAGGRSLLNPRLTPSLDLRLVLRQNDSGDYAMAGISSRDVPGQLPAGRAIRLGDGAEVQLAFVGREPDGPSARQEAERVAAHWAGSTITPVRASAAIRVRPLPRHVSLDDLTPSHPGRVTLGLAGDEATPLSVALFAGSGRLLVAGPPRSGRSTALQLVVTQAVEQGIRVLVAAPSRSPLVEAARVLEVAAIHPDNEPDGSWPALLEAGPLLVAVDDSEAFADTAAGEWLTGLLRRDPRELAAVVAGRTDEIAVAYRGLAAEVRRSRCGLLLRPGRIDGEVLGVRLPSAVSYPPGGGIAVGDASWGPAAGGDPVRVQVAQPCAPAVVQAMCG